MQYARSWFSLPAIFAVLALTGYAAAQEQKQQPKSASKEKVTALTGCVDEKEGHYVLVDDRSLSPIASLQAEGFPTEGFAKHLGHKVTMRGISNSAGATPIFTVRSIETVSDVCGPHQ
jgi:hypothetical protein